MRALQLRPAAFDLKEAAKHLGITHIALTTELRERGILVPSSHGLQPKPEHERSGNFQRSQRSVETDGPTGRIRRHYVVTMVTVQGLAWLANELRRVA